jgi:CBS domain-containing protein
MANTESKMKLVRDLMTVGVVTCSQDTPAQVIAQTILEKEIEGVVVLDEEGHALGVVGQDELICAYASGDYEKKTAQDIMTDGMPQIPPDIPAGVAGQLMQDQGLRAFYLTHHAGDHAGGIEYPAAVITYKHLLKHLASQSDEELKDIGIHAERKPPLDTFIEQRDATKKQNTNID